MAKWMEAGKDPDRKMPSVIAREGYQHDAKRVRRLRISLYLAAKERERKFYTLFDKVCDWDVLVEAWRRIRENGGKGGVDGLEFSDLRGVDRNDHSREVSFIRETQQMLRQKRYRPLPVRRVYIRKANGKLRPLGIPALRCRLVQAAVQIVLEPIFEAQFADSSYGFRPKRSAKQASKVIRDAIQEGYRQVVDLDLADYFGSIPHKQLMERVAERVRDGAVLKLLRGWLNAGYVEEGERHNTPRGTPQGGVVSPLLSNLYLDTIDHLVERSYDAREVQWVRYADDAVLLCRRRAGEVYEEVKRAIETLGLTVNAEKTERVNVQETGFDFLGFHFCWRESPRYRGRFYAYIFPARRSEIRLREKVRSKTSMRAPIPPEEFVTQLNQIVRGWAEYHRHTNASKSFHTAQRFINRRVRSYLMQRGKRRGRGYRQYPDDYLYQKLGLIDLTARGWVCGTH